MDKPLDTLEANAAITMALSQAHSNMARLLSENKPFPPFKEEIENVSVKAMVNIYRHLDCDNKRLLMPWELDGDRMVITYKPVGGVVIWIESEPVEKPTFTFNAN